MPLPRVSLSSFLSSAKNALHKSLQHNSPITFVIGNESAGILPLPALPLLTNNILDLDSLCSAIVLAYLRTYSPLCKSNTVYIPLSNIPSSDLPLRPELQPVLSRASLSPSNLITLSDLPPFSQLPSKIPPERTHWILVDHNALTGELGRLYGSRVVGCIDHHEEENKVPHDCREEPRIVKKSGSCASLVIEYCRPAWDTRSSDKEITYWNAELAALALAPILVDTTNLTDQSKVTSADVEVVGYLEDIIKKEGAFDSEAYFKEISEAKSDIGNLSLEGILRKDYKQWTEGSLHLGVSSVVKDMSFLLSKAGSKDGLLNTVQEFAKARDLSIFSIMTTSVKEGEFRRELFVWALDDQGVAAANKFEGDHGEQLGLKEWSNGELDIEGDGHWARCWWQERVENSRKQVAPLMRTAISKI
jgi:exopolyphosphatase